MIINGDYKFIDFDALRPKFIEAFTKFYGEEYRDVITERINNIKYHPYHSIDFVCDYYNRYINSFNDELEETFFKNAGYEWTPERSKLIMPESYDSVSEIFTAIDGGFDIDNCTSFTAEGREHIKELRNNIKKEFGFEGTDEEVYEKIKSLYNIYLKAEIEIENSHSCEVVEDVKKYASNSVKALDTYLREAKDYGYDVSYDDIALITKKDFSLNDIYHLKCKDILFGDTITERGLIDAFTTESNEVLKNGRETQKIDIITKRLKYLASLNIPFKYLDKESLYEPTEISTYVDTLYKEYEYQKKAENEITFIDYFNYNCKQILNNFKKGQFFPEQLANDLEDIRNACANDVVNDCKFMKSRDLFPLDAEFEFFSYYRHKNGDIYKPYTEIYINEDQIFDTKGLLQIIVHEINHAIGHGEPYKVNQKKSTFVDKEGLNFQEKYKNEDDRYDIDRPELVYYNPKIQTLEENVNERQTKEILDILFAENDIDIGLDDDIYFDLVDREDYNCAYEIYDFLTEEFYNRYKRELKNNKINTSYNLYFKHDLASTKTEKAKELISNIVRRNFKKKDYSKDGYLDFYKVEKLSEITFKFYDKILPYLQDAGLIKDDNTLDYDNMPGDVYGKILELIKRKDKILLDMFEDEKRIQNNGEQKVETINHDNEQLNDQEMAE